MIRLFVIAIGVALVLGAPASAFAKPKLAIVAFEDDSGGELQDVVVEALDGEFTVIGRSKVTRALDKLGLDTDLTTKQLKKLATELEADAIIRGELVRKGSKKILHLKLFKDGKKVRGFRAEFVSASSTKLRDALRDKLLERIGGGGSSEGGEAEEPKPKKKKKKPVEETEGDSGETTASTDEEPKPKKKKKPKAEDAEDGEAGDGESTDAEDPDAKPKKKKVAKRDEDGEGDEEDPVDTDVEIETSLTKKSTSAINRAAVRVDFGISLSQRQLSFTSRAFEEAPKPYSNSPVPGGRVEADIYPLAFMNRNSLIAGIGIGGEFDQTLSLNLQSTVQPGTKFPVKQGHFGIGGRLRVVIGKTARAPSIVVKAGYATRTFKVDRSKLMDGNIIDLPDVGYKGLTAGADLRIPVGGPVAILVGGGGIFVSTTGDIQTSAQYGQAKVTGAEAQLGVDIAIGKRMAVKAIGEFTQMGFAFTGTGQMAINRDGNPDTKDVGGAADRYIGGSVLFGVLY